MRVSKVIGNVAGQADKNDRNQWLAGGYLKESTFPGGELWSPVDTPNIDLIKPSIGKESMLIAGNMEGYLNNPRNQIENQLQGRQLSILFEDNVLEIIVVRVSVDITLQDGSVFELSSENIDISSMANMVSSSPAIGAMAGVMMSSNMSIQEHIAGILGGVLTRSPIGSILGIGMYNLATGKTDRFEQVIGQFTIGQVTNMMSRGITGMVSNVFGISSPLATLSVMAVVSNVFGEVLEMMTGTDRAFGFGGQYAGLGMYEVSNGFLGLDNLVGSIEGFFTGNVDTQYTDAAGNVVGSVSATGVAFGGLFSDTGYTGMFDTNYGQIEVAGHSKEGMFEQLEMEMELGFMEDFGLSNTQFDALAPGSYDVTMGIYKDGWMSGTLATETGKSALDSLYGSISYGGGMAFGDGTTASNELANAINTDNMFGTDYAGNYASNYGGDGNDDTSDAGFGIGEGGFGAGTGYDESGEGYE